MKNQKKTPFPSALLAADLIPQGWKIIEDAEPRTFEVATLRYLPLLQPKPADPFYVSGKQMRERAAARDAMFTLADGKQIIAQQGDIQIPIAMRKNVFILLPGTILRNEDRETEHIGVIQWRHRIGWKLYFRSVRTGYFEIDLLPQLPAA